MGREMLGLLVLYCNKNGKAQRTAEVYHSSLYTQLQQQKTHLHNREHGVWIR